MMQLAHMGDYWGSTSSAANYDWGDMGQMMNYMMGTGYGGGYFSLSWGLILLIEILTVILLIVLIRYFWKKGGKLK